MEKRFFFAKNEAQDIVAIDSIIAAWKSDNNDVVLILNDYTEESRFYLEYESEHLRDLDLARLKSELNTNLR